MSNSNLELGHLDTPYKKGVQVQVGQDSPTTPRNASPKIHPDAAHRTELLDMATAIQKFRGDANRAKVVQLRLAGKTQDAIAAELGFADSSAVRYHLDAWLAAQKPSVEQTEELRQIQAAQLDALTVKLQAMLDTDDYLSVVDRLVKLMERKARLMGLDMPTQVHVGLNLPTAEALAELFGQVDAGAVIDVEAKEITDGVPSEGHS